MIFFVFTGKSYRTMLTGDLNKTFFPTFLMPVCSKRNLHSWALENDFEVVFSHGYDAHTHNMHWTLKPMTYLADIFSRLVSYITKGDVEMLKADYCCLVNKTHHRI